VKRAFALLLMLHRGGRQGRAYTPFGAQSHGRLQDVFGQAGISPKRHFWRFVAHNLEVVLAGPDQLAGVPA
jgi:hypothetical protein